MRTGDYMADCIDPIRRADLLDLTASDYRICDQLELWPAPGHTPGNLVVHVSGSAGAVVLAGDVLHHPLHLARPELSTRYCVEPTVAADTRIALLQRCVEERLVIVPSHFASTPGGRVDHVGGGFGWRPASDLVAHGPHPDPAILDSRALR